MTSKTKAVDFEGDVSLWVDADGQANVGLRGGDLDGGIRVATKATSGAGKQIVRQIILSQLKTIRSRCAKQGIKFELNADADELTMHYSTTSLLISPGRYVRLRMQGEELARQDSYRLAATALEVIRILGWYSDGAVIDNTLTSYLIRLALNMPELRINPRDMVLEGDGYTIRPQMVEAQLGLLTRGASIEQLGQIKEALSHMFATSWAERLIVVMDADFKLGTMDDLLEVDRNVVVVDFRQSDRYPGLHTQSATMSKVDEWVEVLTPNGTAEGLAEDYAFYDRVTKMIEQDRPDSDASGTFTRTPDDLSAERRARLESLLAEAGTPNAHLIAEHVWTAFRCS